MTLDSIGRTHVGRVRAHNEDSLRVDRAHNLFVVADGVGGNVCGELASAMAVETVAEFIRASSADAELTWPYKPEDRDLDRSRMATAIRLANRRIFEASADNPGLRGMSTTLAACHFVKGQCHVAHVGDSRVYRLRDGALTQLTDDHSLLNMIRRERGMTEEEVRAFPLSNVILRAVGAQPDVEAEVSTFDVGQGDLFLICSDGLSDMVHEPQIAEILGEAESLEGACDALVAAANAAGGKDNITALLVRAA